MNIKKIVGTAAAAAALAAGAIGVGAPLAKAGVVESEEGPFSECHLYYNHHRFEGIKLSSDVSYNVTTSLCVVNVWPRPARRMQFDTHKSWGWVTRDCHWNITPLGRGEGWCTATYNSIES